MSVAGFPVDVYTSVKKYFKTVIFFGRNGGQSRSYGSQLDRMEVFVHEPVGINIFSRPHYNACAVTAPSQKANLGATPPYGGGE